MSDARRELRRYERQRHRIPGWLSLVDLRLLAIVDQVQRDAGTRGDVLEIGVFRGKSAVVLGWLCRDDEDVVLCDLFGATVTNADVQDEADRWYPGLARADFEKTWSRFHPRPAIVYECDSAELPSRIDDRRFRIIHVDGAHVEEAVQKDLRTAVDHAAPDAVVVVDDYRTAGLPGVAAALWTAVDRGELVPILFTEAKAYLAVGQAAEVARGFVDAVTRASLSATPVVLRSSAALWIGDRAPLADRLGAVAGRLLQRRHTATSTGAQSTLSARKSKSSAPGNSD